LTIAANREPKTKTIEEYPDDEKGTETVKVLGNSLQILNRMTGNTPGSLGLHPAVYFYNERGKYTRFLFLGMTTLITDKLRNNDQQFFRKFAIAREAVETFLIQNKSLITLALTNTSKGQRTSKMKDLFNYLVNEGHAKKDLTPEAAFSQIGLRGRILELKAPQTGQQISDDTKSMAFLREAIDKAMRCPLCKGLLDPGKSVSYDHIQPVRDGGTGDLNNTQLVHPYCNSSEVGKTQTEHAAGTPQQEVK